MMCAYGVSGHMIQGPPFRWSVEMLLSMSWSGTSIIRCGPRSVTQSSGPVASVSYGSRLLTGVSPMSMYAKPIAR